MKKLFLISLLVFLTCEGEMIQKGKLSTEDPRIPEINIKQGSTNIPSEIGSYIIDESKVIDLAADIVFNIENLGTSELILTGFPVIEISGEGAGEFELIEPPESDIIAPGRSTTFTIRYSPESAGEKIALITIPNNDFDENPYTFEMVAGAEPEIEVRYGSTDIPDETGSYSINNVDVDSESSEYIFTILNTGNYNLVLSGTESIAIEGEDASLFSVTDSPASVIAPGESDTFSVTYTPPDTDVKTATVKIENNDTDEGPYTFTLSGISKPVADFIARVKKGVAPLTVEFTNLSQGSITEYRWDFNGDSIIDSNEENPVKEFTGVNNNSVILFVDGPGGTNFKLKAVYIQTIQPEAHAVSASNSVQDVALCDQDFDGDIDIFANSGGIAFWKNNNYFGTFDPESNVTNDSVSDIDTYDIDGDGSSMEVIALSSTAITIYEFDGTSHLIANITDGKYMHIADIKNDGTADDILYASGDNNEIAWWEHTGNPTAWDYSAKNTIDDTFTKADIVHSGDLDGDGDVDVTGANNNTGTNIHEIVWWQNGGDASGGGDGSSWSVKILIDSGNPRPEAINCADLDGDGDNDIVVAKSSYMDIPDSILWFENDGSGVFGEAQVIDNELASYDAIEIADLDYDGDNDIVCGSDEEHRVYWWENTDGSGTFSSARVVGSADHCNSIDIADINNDGYLDIAANNNFLEEVKWFDLHANTWYKNIASVDIPDVSPLAVSDIDSDGDIDIAGGGSSGTLAWLENLTGEGLFSEKQDIETTLSYISGIDTGDINGDTFPDIIALSFQTPRDVMWFNNNINVSGNFADEVQIQDGYIRSSNCLSADIDSDGDIDVLAEGEIAGFPASFYIHWWQNVDASGSGDGTSWTQFEIYSDNTGTTSYKNIHLADIDNDNDTDIIAIDDENISWFENPADPETVPWTIYKIAEAYSGLSAIYPCDVDQDGDIDLLAGCSYPDKIAYFQNGGSPLDGTSNWTEIIIENETGKVIAPKLVLSADINNNGNPDIIAVDQIGADDNAFYVWFNLGSDTFSRRHVIANSLPDMQSIRAADMDSDGDNDIIATFPDNDEISWWENNLRY